MSPRDAMHAGALGVVVPLSAFFLMLAATRAGSEVAVLGIVVLPLALVALAMRPSLALAGLAGLVVANAGNILSDERGIPNVENTAVVLIVIALAARPGVALQAIRRAPILVAFGAFTAVRILSVLVATSGGDVYHVTKDLILGGALIVLVTVVGGRSSAAIEGAVAALVGTASVLVILSALKLQGIGGLWGGFASDVVESPEAREAALRSLEASTISAERVSGPMGDPNFWAQSLVFAVPLALWLWRDGRTRLMRRFGLATSIVLILGVLQTESRGGALALAAAGGAWLWLRGGRLRWAVVAIPFVLAAIVIASGAASRFGAIADVVRPAQASDASIRGRTSEALVALLMTREHPVIGIGAGEYENQYIAYAPRLGLDERQVREPHNSYLQMAAESGVLGLIAFVAMLGTALVGVLAAGRRLVVAGMGREARLAHSLGAGLLGYCVAATFLHQAFPRVLWLALGLCAAIVVLSRSAAED